MYQRYAYKPLLQWLLMIGLLLIALIILWDKQVLTRLLLSDITRISWFILVVTLCASLYCGVRCYLLSMEDRSLACYEQLKTSQGHIPHVQLTNSAIDHYLYALQQQYPQALYAELLAEKLRGRNQLGWFLAGLVIKLGLLGTVVGFVIMLSSISGLETLDLSGIKSLMQQMTQGMGVAMNTTMVGLVASILLGTQYLLLDRFADQLLVDVIEFAGSDGRTDETLEGH